VSTTGVCTIWWRVVSLQKGRGVGPWESKGTCQTEGGCWQHLP